MRGQPKLKLVGLLIGALGGAVLLQAPGTGASSVDWTSSEPQYDGVVSEPAYVPPCENRTVMIDGLNKYTKEPDEASICYRDRGSWGYGRYSFYRSVFNKGKGDAIQFGVGGAIYRINGDLTANGYAQLLDVPGSNDVVRKHRGAIQYYRNFPSKFTLSSSAIYGTLYDFNQSDFDFQLSQSNGEAVKTDGFALSNNGKWAVVEARGVGLVRINLKTFAVKRFSTINIRRSQSRWPSPSVSMAVSNDGTHAVIAGWNAGYYRVFSITPDCGDTFDGQMTTETPIAVQCDWRGLRDAIREGNSKPHQYADTPRFTDDGGQLTLLMRSTFGGPPSEWVQLTAGDYTPFKNLSYLALGDSYSSGEGDYHKPGEESHYTPVTDFKGGCHLSTRSYPFLLRDKWGLQSDSMQSVACSGAKINPDYMGNMWSYAGQRGQLDNLDEDQKTRLRDRALDVYLPGYVPQLEFVKKYKPDVVTLTGGGNDVGFAEKLTECATSFLSCRYVASGESRAKMGYEIQAQFEKLRKLYLDIRQASPDTEVYVLGYPSFINDGIGRVCGLDAGFMNSNERYFVNRSVDYLNKVISSAATAAGVQYIDLTDSLVGGRMCDVGGEYVTGMIDIRYINKESQQQTFHPNAKGHKKIEEHISKDIKEAIDGETSMVTPDGSVAAPWPDSYFTEYMLAHEDQKGARIAVLMEGDVTVGSTKHVSVGDYTFQQNSVVTATVYSEPVGLGTFVSGSRGGLQADIMFPDSLPVGYHTVEFSGLTYSGEPLHLYQQVIVESGNPDDRDSDGILDEHDRCMFMETASEGQQNEVSRYCSTPDSSLTGSSGETAKIAIMSSGVGSPLTMSDKPEGNGSAEEAGVSSKEPEAAAISDSEPIEKLSQKPSAGHNDSRWMLYVMMIVFLATVTGIAIIIRRAYVKSQQKK